MFCKDFIAACNLRDSAKLTQLSQKPEFEQWFETELHSGVSRDDEYYAYFGKTEVEKTIGSRLSFLSYLSVDTDEYREDLTGLFPEMAQSFHYKGAKYWVNTVLGQGASSVLYSDAKFQEYWTKRNEAKIS